MAVKVEEVTLMPVLVPMSMSMLLAVAVVSQAEGPLLIEASDKGVSALLLEKSFALSAVGCTITIHAMLITNERNNTAPPANLSACCVHVHRERGSSCGSWRSDNLSFLLEPSISMSSGSLSSSSCSRATVNIRIQAFLVRKIARVACSWL